MVAQDPMSAQPHIDTTAPHTARVYDWLLGGKDNFPADEAVGRQLLTLNPNARIMARCNRAFMHRAVRWLAGRGVRQFLDIGTGIPTEPNLHQVAQEVAPEARVVYADHDPIVLRHAQALLRSTPEGATEYVQADARDPKAILHEAGRTLDLEKPVALSLCALLHFLTDDEAYDVVRDLLRPLAPGSYLLVSHATGDFEPEKTREGQQMYRAQGMTLEPRSRVDVARFFNGLELVEPGVVVPTAWHPDLGEVIDVPGDTPISGYGAVGRKL
ncbi:SAM-dependent methyltransferase [Streptomyces sp. NPDC060194]|uniref:SAM-dependent methyltransferase n=1 Tax=Streptomyces sp. NPDC060194 TaxID=3347069 RepID=UPI00365EAE2E